MYLCRTVIFHILCHTILWKAMIIAVSSSFFITFSTSRIILARCRMFLSRYHNCACNISLSWCQYIVARLCYQRYRSISFGVITLAYLTYYTTSQIVFHRASSTSTLQKHGSYDDDGKSSTSSGIFDFLNFWLSKFTLEVIHPFIFK